MRYFIILSVILISSCTSVRLPKTDSTVNLDDIKTRYSEDVLRGSDTEFRNWWNVLRYDMVLEPNYEEKFISGTVILDIEKIKNASDPILQIDLQEPMRIEKIVELNHNLKLNKIEEYEVSPSHYTRLKNTYFIDVSTLKNLNTKQFQLKFYFEGKPKIAKNAPWDGGWIFTTDEKGRPWMSAAVQGLGASAWYPCKDYQGDEPDKGATITLIVPEDLVAVSNGQLWETSLVQGEAGTNVYTWEVKNPINNYNIIPYIGHYVNISDQYMGKDGPLSLEYWVLDYNEVKAKEHFKQVKPMLTAFEENFGSYPFYQDGFKLVESPYLGMEHQSAIAYGNKFKNGYLGQDRSGSGYGYKFDFIIVHEAGHEWFGNSITAKDIADMWIHEGFTSYAEALYVEYQWGEEAANEYVQGLIQNIKNDKPIIGTYGIQEMGSIDMYNKGAAMIHTLRQLMQDDYKFKAMLLAMNEKFYHQTVTSKEIEDFISSYSGLNLKSFFEQYLRNSQIPTLEIKEENGEKFYRWTNVVDGFAMLMKLADSEEWINPTQSWKLYEGKTDLIPDPNFYIHSEY